MKIIEILKSWQSIIILMLLTVAFLIYIIWYLYRPKCLSKAVEKIKRIVSTVLSIIRKRLRNNKKFMKWLYSEKHTNRTDAGIPIKVHNDWRR